MGRTQQSQGLAPPAIRKDQRAKQARQFINKTIPALLVSNPRARKGAEGSELILDPPPVTFATNHFQKEKSSEDETKYIKRKGQGRRKAKGTAIITEDDDEIITQANHEKRHTHSSSGKSKKPKDTLTPALSSLHLTTTSPLKIRIINTTTLTAAHSLLPIKPSAKHPNPCILNMASPLRPGGGVLAGATSQEETLCTSTSLLPSLNESFYRLPEYGGIFTRDVLVLREEKTGRELSLKERWWVDVISAGMLRFPDLVGEDGEEEEKRLGKKDIKIVEGKIRAVLRIAAGRGVRKLVLGAWGCGAYGNPVRDVAEAFYTILCSPSCSSGDLGGIDEVVFAIPSRKMAEGFAGFFDPEGRLEVEDGPGGGEEGEEEEERDEVAEELRRKIEEMEGQVGRVWNEELKTRMMTILEGLRGQLRERVGDNSGWSNEGSEVKD